MSPAALQFRSALGGVWILAISLLSAEALVDHLPRFFQGDSISYLSTTTTELPPDRSWAYGLAIHWLLRAAGNHSAYLVLQLGLLMAVLVASLAFFDLGVRRSLLAYTLFVVAACLDPLIGLYARFYMTDLPACLLFVAFLAAASQALRASRAGFVYWLPAIAVLLSGAVFTRVAYLPVSLVTLLIVGAWVARFRRGLLGRLAALLLLPLLAAGALGTANLVVFADRFPGEFFLTKSSGVFLLGTFAPAVISDDFRAAGVPVSDDDVAALDLPNYDKRGAQIWGTDERSAQILIRHRLGLESLYPAKLDRVAGQIVWHALLRDPLSIARVYGTSLLFHFQPSQWMRFIVHETGLTRRLPQAFVDNLNRIAGPPILPETTEVHSPVLDVFLYVAPVYPVLLLVGGALAIWKLVTRDLCNVPLIEAALLAVLLTAPLYTVYVIPRYVIAAVLLTYLTVAQSLSASKG